MNRNRTIKENHMFSAVFKRGKSAASANVAVYALKNYKRKAPTRIGISASAKFGGAVKRNRVKRIIREAARCHYPSLPDGYFIVIAARKPCFDSGRKSTAVAAELKRIFTDLKLLTQE